MSNSDLHAAVIGASGIADVLERSGRFETVWRFDSIFALKNGIGSLSAVATNKITFLFADNAPSGNADITLSDLVRRLTSRSYRVVILECSPNARLIVDTNPSAGLIPHPISCNIVLGALSERGAGVIPPVEEPWAYQTLDPSNQLALPRLPEAVSNPLSDLDDVFSDVFSGLAPVTGNSSGSVQHSEPPAHQYQPNQEPTTTPAQAQPDTHSAEPGWDHATYQPTQELEQEPTQAPIQTPSAAPGWDHATYQPTQEPTQTPSAAAADRHWGLMLLSTTDHPSMSSSRKPCALGYSRASATGIGSARMA